MKKFKDMDSEERCSWGASLCLQKFVEEGGRGLRGAISLILNVQDQESSRPSKTKRAQEKR